MALKGRTSEQPAMVNAVLDYFEGWFDGDAGLVRTTKGWRIVNALWEWT